MSVQGFLWMMVMVSGACMISAGLIMLRRNYSFQVDTSETLARVHESNGRKVFRFTTQQGDPIELPALIGTAHYVPGDEVRVMYFTHRPHVAYIKRRLSVWPPLVTALLGLPLAALGCTGLISVAP